MEKPNERAILDALPPEVFSLILNYMVPFHFTGLAYASRKAFELCDWHLERTRSCAQLPKKTMPVIWDDSHKRFAHLGNSLS